MDLYNWYENSFPNDFKQLVKIKHYNISNVSFLLSNVWYKLEYGEKLLMCAVYYDDFNLVKQLINEKILFRVNPFLSKNYFVQKPNKPNLNSYNSIDILYDNQAMRHNSVTSDHRLCICHNAIRLRMLSTDIDSTSSTSRHDSISTFEPNEPTYFFNQIVHEPNLQSPFYLAVKLNKLNICELFLDFFKSMFAKQRYSSQNQPTIYMNQINFVSFNKNNKYFRPLNACCLNAVISDSELGKLILITLINRNYDIAKLILSNIFNPKFVFNFKPCSESFITNDDFCLFLVKDQIVDLKIMLKEAVYRHAATTVITIINHIEQNYEFKKNKIQLIELLNLIMTYAVSVGDFKIFYHMLCKLITHIQINQAYIRSKLNLTVENILQLSVLRKAKRSEHNPALMNEINIEKLEENAKLMEFDLKSYLNMAGSNSSSKKNLLTSSLSLANRIKLLNLIHNNTDSREFKIPWIQFELELKQKIINYERLFDPIDKTRRIHCCHYVNILESQPFIIKILLDKLDKSYVITNRDLIMTAKSAHSELSLYYLIDELEFGVNAQNRKLLEPIDDLDGNFLEVLFCRMVKSSKPEQEMRMRKLFFEAIILKNARMTCTTNLANLFCSDSEYVQSKLINVYFPCLFYLSSSFQIFYSDLCSNRFKYLINWHLRNYFFDKDELSSMPYLSDDLKRKQVMFGYLAYKRKEKQQLEQTFISNSSSSISISSLSANLEDEIMSDQSIVADADPLSSQSNSTTSAFPANSDTSMMSDTYSTSTTSTGTTVICNNNLNNKQTTCANRRKLDLTLKDLSRTSFMSIYLKNCQVYSQFVNAINDSFRHYIFCFHEIYNLFDDYQFP